MENIFLLGLVAFPEEFPWNLSIGKGSGWWKKNEFCKDSIKTVFMTDKLHRHQTDSRKKPFCYHAKKGESCLNPYNNKCVHYEKLIFEVEIWIMF